MTKSRNVQGTVMMRNEDDRRFSQTLARGIQVLRAFKPTDGPLGNQELFERTGIPKPTISRLTFTLTKLGYLEHLSSYEKYRLGPAAIALGNVANSTIPFIESAAELMQPFCDEVGALVGLAMRDGDRMLMTHCWRPVNLPSIWLNVGIRLPITTTATGWTYLATIDRSRSLKIAEEITLGDEKKLEVLKNDIEECRQNLLSRGFSHSIGRWNPTVNSVAVSFSNSSFAEPLVFFCGAPADMASEETILNTFGPKLARRVRQLDLTTRASANYF